MGEDLLGVALWCRPALRGGFMAVVVIRVCGASKYRVWCQMGGACSTPRPAQQPPEPKAAEKAAEAPEPEPAPEPESAPETDPAPAPAAKGKKSRRKSAALDAAAARRADVLLKSFAEDS